MFLFFLFDQVLHGSQPGTRPRYQLLGAADWYDKNIWRCARQSKTTTQPSSNKRLGFYENGINKFVEWWQISLRCF